MKKVFLSLIVCIPLFSAYSQGGLPVWPLVTGYVQTTMPEDLVSTTPHQYIDWTSSGGELTLMTDPVAASNQAAPAQAGIDACGKLAFMAMHNGETAYGSSFLQLFDADGAYMPLSEGDMNCNIGDADVQVVRRPGKANQWFII